MIQMNLLQNRIDSQTQKTNLTVTKSEEVVGINNGR